MPKTILATLLTLTLCALAAVVVAVWPPDPPCALPAGIERALATEQQIALPGLDAQLHECVQATLGGGPYSASGHAGWDGYLEGDASALSNREKAGALILLGGEGAQLGPGVNLLEIYDEHRDATEGALGLDDDHPSAALPPTRPRT